MRLRGTVAVALLTGSLACAGIGVSAINSWNEAGFTAAEPTMRALPTAGETILTRSAVPVVRAERPRPQQPASGTVVHAALFDPSPMIGVRQPSAAPRAVAQPQPQQRQAAVPMPAAKPYVTASVQSGAMPVELMPEPAEPLPAAAMALADPQAHVPSPAAAPAKPDPKAVAAAKRAAEKAEKIDPNNLTPAQIARVKATLNITPDQEAYWQPVEAALLDIAKQQAARRARGSKYAMPATDSQQLYWTAGPLIMNLRPDQKQEARNLARSLGMTTVASLI